MSVTIIRDTSYYTYCTRRPSITKGNRLRNKIPTPPEKKNVDKNLLNDGIKFPQVMVIGPNGEKIGVKSIYEARSIASGLNLDLYCVAPNGVPPVCKILDYPKFRFDSSKKEREQRKNQKIIQQKELKLNSKIAERDFQIKVKQTIKWLQDGAKVLVSLKMRGREQDNFELSLSLVRKFIECVGDNCIVEKEATRVEKSITANIAPKKSNKGEKKDAKNEK